MTDKVIVNPLSALREVTDYRTGMDRSGEKLGMPSDMREFRAAGTIARGDVVVISFPASATDPAGVLAAGALAVDHLSAALGVAEDAAAAGDVVPVCIYGLTYVNVGAGTPAGGNRATVQAASPQAGVAAAVEDATTVLGSQLGMFWGAKDANNRAPVFVNLR